MKLLSNPPNKYMREELNTIEQILLLEKRRKEEGITEAEVLLLEENYKKIGYKETSTFNPSP